MEHRFLWLPFVVLIARIGVVGGVDYYVSPQGSDGNPGTEAKPWKTIQKAADALVAGDTVFIKAGVYRERVMPRNSGKPGAYITYTAYPGDRVTVDGAGIPFHWAGLFHMRKRRYIKVSGLRIVNSAYFGIEVTGNTDHLVIEKNDFRNCQSSGIHVWFNDGHATITDVIIDGNEITETNMNGSQEAISVCGVDGFDIRNNHVHHVHKEGIDAKQGSSNGRIYKNHVHHFLTKFAVGIYVDASDNEVENVDIYQNTVHDARSGICLATERGGTLRNIGVYNNVVYNCGHGFAIHRYTKPGSHSKKNVRLINNTFHNNRLAVRVTEVRENFENFVIRNNIFNGTDGEVMNLGRLSETDIVIDHNLFGPSSGARVRGENAVAGDAKFMNASEADFRLRKDSPAIDRGSSVGAPASDFEGNTRPQDGGYDIGAYEHK